MQTTIPKLLQSFALEGPIRTVVFSSDGKRILTGGHKGGSVRVWDLNTENTGKQDGGKRVLLLQGHSRPVALLTVAVSGNGDDVVTAGDDGKILLWTKVSKTAASAQEKPKPKTLFSSPDTKHFSSLIFNPADNIPTIIACAHTNGAVDIWQLDPDAGATSRTQQIVVTETKISSVYFESANDPSLLALVCGGGKIKIFNIHSGIQTAEVNSKAGTVLAFAWIPATKHFILAVHKTMYVHDAENPEIPLAILVGHSQAIKCLAIYPGGQYFASGGDDKVLRVWDAHTYVQIGSSPFHPGAISHIAFSPDGKWIVSVSRSKTAFLWAAHEFGMDESPPTPSSTGSNATRSSTPVPEPLAEYFARYPEFDYDPDEPPTSEFYRMCDFFEWARHSQAREEAYGDFRIALTQQFNTIYGTDAESLSSWQLLCAKLGINPIPQSTKECREIVCSTHVNLVDLVHESARIQIFPDVYELSDYSKMSGKIFPRDEAYAGGVLRYLLRHISNPSLDGDRSAASNRRGRANGGRRRRGGR